MSGTRLQDALDAVESDAEYQMWDNGGRDTTSLAHKVLEMEAILSDARAAIVSGNEEAAMTSVRKLGGATLLAIRDHGCSKQVLPVWVTSQGE